MTIVKCKASGATWHTNETSSEVLSHGTIYFLIFTEQNDQMTCGNFFGCKTGALFEANEFSRIGIKKLVSKSFLWACLFFDSLTLISRLF